MLSRFTRTHICSHPLKQFELPITLAYRDLGRFTTQTTINGGVMRLIEDAMFEVLLMRNQGAWRILVTPPPRRSYTIVQQPLMDGISM